MNTLILAAVLLSQICTTNAAGVTTCRSGGLLGGIFGSRSTTMMGSGMMGSGMMGYRDAVVPSTSYVVPSTSYVVPSTSYVVPSTSYVPPYRDSGTLESPEVVMGYHKVKHQGVVLTVYGYRNENNMIQWEPDHPHNQRQLIRKTILAERLSDGR